MTIKPMKQIVGVRGGGGASSPNVRISETGQITLNKKAAVAFEGKALALLGFDEDSRTFEIKAITVPSPFPPKGVKVGTETFAESDFAKINWPSKAGAGPQLSMSGILKVVGYDFATSKGQRFECSVNGSAIQFVLPNGALPVVATTRKPRGTGKAKVAAAGATNGTAKELEQELERELA